MEHILSWFNNLSPVLGLIVNILVIAIVFLTTVTLLAGMWIGYCIARKRMNQIAEIEFFPPKITFKEKV
jgi:uncharacterized protein YneF (UPF0154 family)